MKIYTKTGDGGTTGLIGGSRVNKNDVRLEAYGTVDELNAQIGLLITHGLKDEHEVFLKSIQNLLFTVGSNLATDTSKTQHKRASLMKEEYITAVEREIDRLDTQLHPLTYFTLPGGTPPAAQSHVCRTVARRAERRIIEMNDVYPVDSKVIIYINRLSDYFFVLSRVLLMERNVKEIAWKQPE